MVMYNPTTDALMSQVRALALTPDTAQLASNDESLLRFMNWALSTTITPLIMTQKKEYFVAYKDFNNYVDPISGIWQQSYPIPNRAMYSKLRSLNFLSLNAGVYIESAIPELPVEQASNYFSAPSGNAGASVWGFYYQGNDIVFWPPQKKENTFRMKYFRRPSALVGTKDAAQITSVNYVTNSISLSKTSLKWDSKTLLDFIDKGGMYSSKAIDQVIKNISLPTISFDKLPPGLEVGDWVSEAGTSPIPQIPIESHYLLIQATLIKLLESLKDKVGLDIAVDRMKEATEQFKTIISQGRNEGSPRKISSTGGGIDDYAGSIGIGISGFRS